MGSDLCTLCTGRIANKSARALRKGRLSRVPDRKASSSISSQFNVSFTEAMEGGFCNALALLTTLVLFHLSIDTEGKYKNFIFTAFSKTCSNAPQSRE